MTKPLRLKVCRRPYVGLWSRQEYPAEWGILRPHAPNGLMFAPDGLVFAAFGNDEDSLTYAHDAAMDIMDPRSTWTMDSFEWSEVAQ